MAKSPRRASVRGMDAGDETATMGWLDRWPARLTAAVVLVGCIALLAYIHWRDISPEMAEMPSAADPSAACIAARHGEVDQMLADGVIDEFRVASFKARAEDFCRSRPGQGNPPTR